MRGTNFSRDLFFYDYSSQTTITIDGSGFYNESDFQGIELNGGLICNANNSLHYCTVNSVSDLGSITPYSIYARLNGKVFFAGNTSSQGKELWVTDGTQSGTQVFMDINPGSYDGLSGEYPGNDFYREIIAATSSYLFFNAEDGLEFGEEVWISDGTVQGTKPLLDSNGNRVNAAQRFRTLNDKAYFISSDSAHGRELWVSDGTQTGTYVLYDFYQGPTDGAWRLIKSGDRLWISSKTAASSATRYFISDGTSSGTYEIKGSGAYPNDDLTLSSSEGIHYSNGRFYFLAHEHSNGIELYSVGLNETQGTLIADLTPGPADSDIEELAVVDNALYFPWFTSQFGKELFYIDVSYLTSLNDRKPSSGELSLFPNPTADLLNLVLANSRSNIEGAEVWIYDNLGKMVLRTDFPGNPSQISLEKLTPGTYQLNLRLGNELISKRIIKN